MLVFIFITFMVATEMVYASPIRLRRSMSNLPQIINLLMQEQHLQLSQIRIMENTTAEYASALPEIVGLLTAGYQLQAKQAEVLENVTATATAALPQIVRLLESHSQQLENISSALEKLEKRIVDIPTVISDYLRRQENASELLMTSQDIRNIPLTARDCSDIAAQGPYASGPYTITPFDELGPIKVWCDMETAGGGWTVFQRRFDGSVNFYRGWDDYKKGFGNVDHGEYWLGLNHISRLTSTSQSWQLRVDLTDSNNNTSYAHYANFAVGDESTLFKLTVGCYDGTARDSMRENNNLPFSTKDRDYDSHNTFNCAQNRKGAWWYEACTYSNLNGQYLGPGIDSPRAMYWHKWKERPEALKKSEMKIRPFKS